MEIGVRDDAPPRVTDTLAAAQGSVGEVDEDVVKHIIQEAVHCIPHVAGLLHLEAHQQPKR